MGWWVSGREKKGWGFLHRHRPVECRPRVLYVSANIKGWKE